VSCVTPSAIENLSPGANQIKLLLPVALEASVALGVSLPALASSALARMPGPLLLFAGQEESGTDSDAPIKLSHLGQLILWRDLLSWLVL